MPKSIVSAAFAAALLLAAGQAAAAEHVVQMLNSGADGAMVLEPGVVKARPGDTIRFVPTSPGHNAEMVPGMVPAGVALAKGAMGKELVVKVTTPGVYVFRCLPHYGMGMVAVVQVGAPTNLAAIKAAVATAPTMAKRRLMTDLAAIK